MKAQQKKKWKNWSILLYAERLSAANIQLYNSTLLRRIDWSPITEEN
jgi:hypothetical protein